MASKPRLVVATGNADKLREIKAILDGTEIELLSMHDFPGFPEVLENHDTLEGNAIKKACKIHDFTGLPSIADDTGLEVDALAGKPGVYSSRFAGEQASYEDNVNKLLADMKEVRADHRQARFRTVMALKNRAKLWTVEGIQQGEILFGARGENGFGYDPVFYVPELKQSFAEMAPELKNRISHRGKALHELKKIIHEHFSEVFYE